MEDREIGSKNFKKKRFWLWKVPVGVFLEVSLCVGLAL